MDIGGGFFLFNIVTRSRTTVFFIINMFRRMVDGPCGDEIVVVRTLLMRLSVSEMSEFVEQTHEIRCGGRNNTSNTN